MDEELYERLRSGASRSAAAQGVPAYVVFTDATLTALAERRPTAIAELVDIAGIGPRKLGAVRRGGARPRAAAPSRPI